ncbi:MAG: septation protein SpoVG family protein [Planctomycetota bacterium]|jgi:DNA-binding cell septation regulator SpoVG
MERTCSIKLVDVGSLKALVSVQMEDMEIRGFKVIDQGDGRPWVAPPSREVNRDGKKEYVNIVRFPDLETRKVFSNWVLKAYHQEKNGNGQRLD